MTRMILRYYLKVYFVFYLTAKEYSYVMLRYMQREVTCQKVSYDKLVNSLSEACCDDLFVDFCLTGN